MYTIEWSSYSTEHAFVSHDANGEEVYWTGVVLSAHNFRSHVAWSAWCVLSVFLPPNSSNTEVSYTQVAFITKWSKLDRINFSFRFSRSLLEWLETNPEASKPNLMQLELKKLKLTVTLKNQVFWLDVSMNDLLLVDVLEASDKTCYKET